MTNLSDLQVNYAAGDFGGRGTLVTCRDGAEVVLAVISVEAIDDSLQRSDLTSHQRTMVVDRNLPKLAEVIARKYDAGEVERHMKDGRTLPLVLVRFADLQGVELEGSVLNPGPFWSGVPSA